jgi:hypothetical protein
MEGTIMRSKFSPRVALVLTSLFWCLGGSGIARAALTAASVTTNQGCDPGTSFKPGDSITISFSVTQGASDTSHVTLTLQNGSTMSTLFNQNLMGPVSPSDFPISGTIGSNTGTRTLTLTVTPISPTTGSQITKMCSYTVVSATQTLTGNVQTQRGCDVTFQPGDVISYFVTSSLPAHAHVELSRTGSMQVLFDGDVPAGTSPVAQRIASSTTGLRTITLTLTKTGFTTVMDTCTYNVQSGIFSPTRP